MTPPPDGALGTHRDAGRGNRARGHAPKPAAINAPGLARGAHAEGVDWPRNVPDELLAHVLEAERQLVADMLPDGA